MKKIILAVVVVGLFTFLYLSVFKGIDQEQMLDYVIEHIAPDGTMRDIQKDIDVNEVSDIGYLKTKDGYVLHYGKVDIKIDTDFLQTPGVISKLERMGIKVYQTDTGYRFTWKEEEVQECIN